MYYIASLKLFMFHKIYFVNIWRYFKSKIKFYTFLNLLFKGFRRIAKHCLYYECRHFHIHRVFVDYLFFAITQLALGCDHKLFYAMTHLILGHIQMGK